MGESGSCSGRWGHPQRIFNPILCQWAGLCSLPAVWPEASLEQGKGSNGNLLQKGFSSVQSLSAPHSL